MVSHFIRRVTQHQHNLFATFSNTAQADCKTVSAQNRENNTYGFAAELIADIGCDVFDRAIILLWLENMSYQDIANVMGLTVANVTTRLYRIKEQLKSMSNN